MDSFQGQNGGNQPRRGTGRLGGTGPLNAGGLDSFQSTGTGMLGAPGQMGTRRLNTAGLDVERTLADLQGEVDNGQVLVSKLEGRILVLQRALQICDRPIEAPQVVAGLSAGEAGYTKQVAQLLQQDPNTRRRVQVAIYQFEQANKGLLQASQALAGAVGLEGTDRAQYVDEWCHVEKLRGQLYPLVNLHMVFKDTPLLAQLIPAPKAPMPGEMAPPPSRPQPQQAAARPAPGAAPAAGANAPRGTGRLPAPIAQDPAVQQVVDSVQKVTGNLKDKLFGVFGAKKK